MNEFADSSNDSGFLDEPQNNIVHDLDHLGADVIDAPPMDQQMAPMRPQLSEEELEERKSLLFKIRRVRNSRVGKRKLDAEMMSKTESIYTDGLTNDELFELFEDLKYSIGTHEDADLFMLGVQQVAPVVEGILTAFTPIKARGFGIIMDPYQNERVYETIEEISFDYEPKYMSPYQRLGFIMLDGIKKLHAHNSAIEAKVAEQLQAKQACQKVVDTLKDLPQ